MKFTFKHKCEVCGQKPVYDELGMCAVCTHGTASAQWDWIDQDYEGKELKRATDLIFETMGNDDFMDDEGNWNPIAAMLLHITPEVQERMDYLCDKYLIEQGEA